MTPEVKIVASSIAPRLENMHRLTTETRDDCEPVVREAEDRKSCGGDMLVTEMWNAALSAGNRLASEIALEVATWLRSRFSAGGVGGHRVGGRGRA